MILSRFREQILSLARFAKNYIFILFILQTLDYQSMFSFAFITKQKFCRITKLHNLQPYGTVLWSC